MNVEDRAQLDKMIAHFDLNMDMLAKCQTWRDLDEHYTIKIHP